MIRSGKKHVPCALTIAGSDSGGGAGIQADLKVFSALGVHGTSAITCLTAQNPAEVTAIQPASALLLRRQIQAVQNALLPAAVKTGMLYSESLIRVVCKELDAALPLVVDPVMVSTSGKRLLKPGAVRTLVQLLLPRATLITPNLDEAEWLAGMRIRDPEDLRLAAHVLHDRFGCAVLAKGGHLQRCREALDIFFDGRNELLLEAPFIRNVGTHGTGCTYSAAITAYLARGMSLVDSVRAAKDFITRAIHSSVRVGKHWALRPH